MWCSFLTIFFSLPLRFTSEKLFKSIQMVSSNFLVIIILICLHPKNFFEVEWFVDAIMMVQGIRERF